MPEDERIVSAECVAGLDQSWQGGRVGGAGLGVYWPDGPASHCVFSSGSGFMATRNIRQQAASGSAETARHAREEANSFFQSRKLGPVGLTTDLMLTC